MDMRLTNDWPFAEPRDAVTITMRQVLEGSEPILLVLRNAEDTVWQFLGTSDGNVEDAEVVSLEEIVELDSTILELADLPPGWQASREQAYEPWTRRRNEIGRAHV